MKSYGDEYINMLQVTQANLQQAHETAWAIHWLMRGSRFLTDHPLIDGMLEELFEETDWIAERIIQVGGMPLPVVFLVEKDNRKSSGKCFCMLHSSFSWKPSESKKNLK